MSIQKSFLRVLQERSFRPVGGNEEIKSDFRVIAATNRDLEEQIRQGDFREDLYFRLKALHIVLSPLHERSEDIRPLVVHRIDQLCNRYDIETKGFSPEFLEMLQHYSWPGNVRELFNVLERALAAAGQTPTLYPMHLPTRMRLEQIGGAQASPGQVNPVEEAVDELMGDEPLPSLKDYRDRALSAVEYKYLSLLLKSTQGNVKEACRVAELSTSRFYDLLKKHNLSPKQIS
jgi:two-component system NtrC family response regulator